HVDHTGVVDGRRRVLDDGAAQVGPRSICRVRCLLRRHGHAGGVVALEHHDAGVVAGRCGDEGGLPGATLAAEAHRGGVPGAAWARRQSPPLPSLTSTARPPLAFATTAGTPTCCGSPPSVTFGLPRSVHVAGQSPSGAFCLTVMTCWSEKRRANT